MAEEKEEVVDKKAEEKQRKKEEAKQKKAQHAAESDELEEESGGSKVAVFFVSLLIIVVWFAIIALLIKWDVGGFGSGVLAPILKDVPYVNKILPDDAVEQVSTEDSAYAYDTMADAVERIKELEKEQLRTDLPKLEVGDTVRVFVKVVEGNRERLQNFEGIVIKMQGGGIRETFTVRRVSYGVGVERTFPYHSPRIGRIEVVRHGQVRRAKLYYLRNRVGKAAKIVERIVTK